MVLEETILRVFLQLKHVNVSLVSDTCTCPQYGHCITLYRPRDSMYIFHTPNFINISQRSFITRRMYGASMSIAPYSKEEDFVAFAKTLAHTLHAGQTRRTGKPYITHPGSVVHRNKQIILQNSPYAIASSVGCWLHDAVEDLPDIDIFNPFTQTKPIHSDKIFVNDLFIEAGEQGIWSCYIIEKMTHRDGTFYHEYMNEKYHFAPEGVQRDLDICELIVKLCDKTDNSVPHEPITDVSRELESYKHYEESSEEVLREFYKRKRVLGEFTTKGDFSYNPEFYELSLRRKYTSNKVHTAQDNIYRYLPLAEKQLLIEEKHAHNRIYDPHALRELLKECFCYSIETLIEHGVYADTAYVYLADSGLNRRNKEVADYQTIATEIKEVIQKTGTIPYIAELKK